MGSPLTKPWSGKENTLAQKKCIRLRVNVSETYELCLSTDKKNVVRTESPSEESLFKKSERVALGWPRVSVSRGRSRRAYLAERGSGIRHPIRFPNPSGVRVRVGPCNLRGDGYPYFKGASP